MDANVFAAALQQDVVAISLPSLGEGGLNDSATVSQPKEFGMGHHIFKKPMCTSVAQKIRRRNKHAGCRDRRTCVRNKDGDPFLC